MERPRGIDPAGIMIRQPMLHAFQQRTGPFGLVLPLSAHPGLPPIPHRRPATAFTAAQKSPDVSG